MHINGVYDHYSWRAFLGSGGDADQIYKPLDGWKPGGSRAQELDFWMNEPIPPQNTSSGAQKKKPGPAAAPKAAKKTPVARTGKKAAPVKAAKKSTAKKSKAKKSKVKKSKAKKSKKTPGKSKAKKSRR